MKAGGRVYAVFVKGSELGQGFHFNMFMEDKAAQDYR